jgi:hypothetical protein
MLVNRHDNQPSNKEHLVVEHSEVRIRYDPAGALLTRDLKHWIRFIDCEAQIIRDVLRSANITGQWHGLWLYHIAQNNNAQPEGCASKQTDSANH